VSHPELDVETNALGEFHVLEAARKSETVNRLVFASSNAAVGEVEGAVDEERIPEPLAPYGASKLYGEALCSVYWHTYDIHTTSLRFANAYGPYSGHKTSVVPKFLRRAKQGKDLEIYGDGEQTRDFIHSEDIARVIGRALEGGHPGGEVFQVATAQETRIKDLAEWIREIAGDHGQSIDVHHTDPRPGEIRYNYSSIEKVSEMLGWEPRREFRPSIESLWEAEGPASVTSTF
jgi:UDP-glucose 4-epimerase